MISALRLSKERFQEKVPIQKDGAERFIILSTQFIITKTRIKYFSKNGHKEHCLTAILKALTHFTFRKNLNNFWQF